MKKFKNHLFIYILLFIIIVCCIVLIVKIKAAPEYDVDLYEEIYGEYEKIITNDINNLKPSNENDGSMMYIDENMQGVPYKVIATISIPKIKIEYPIIFDTTEEYLKIAPTKLYGPNPNQIGNFCIIGHNYDNNKQFSKLKLLENDDIVIIADKNNKQQQYKVYDKYIIEDTDLSCTSQNTKGRRELTLITCTNRNKNERLVVKCAEE